MSTQPELPSAIDERGKFVFDTVPPERMLQHFKGMVANMMGNAQNTWALVWKELQDSVVGKSGVVLTQAQSGFSPECGWPEFLERLCQLKHYLDHTRRMCEENRR